jgi:Transcriptional regulator/sugar kinase
LSDFAFGVDIGGTRVKAGLVDISKGEILSSKVFESAKNEELFLSNLKNALEVLRLSNGLERRQICGAGVSVTGFVHSDGVMGRTSAAFLPFLSEYPIKKRLTETLEMPVRVDSDGRLVCYGECLFGAGRGYGRVLLITLGTGIGFCLLENATIPDYPAVLHMGGHIKVKNSDEKCYCGLTGCFEQLCSGPALSRRFFEQTGLEKDGEAIFRMAETKTMML